MVEEHRGIAAVVRHRIAHSLQVAAEELDLVVAKDVFDVPVGVEGRIYRVGMHKERIFFITHLHHGAVSHKGKSFFALQLAIVAGEHHLLHRVDQHRMPECLPVAGLPFIIEAVAGEDLVEVVDPAVLPEAGHVGAGVVPAVLAIDGILFPLDGGRAIEISHLRNGIVHQGIGMHNVFGIDQDHLFLEEEFLRAGMVIAVFADQHIFVVDDLCPVFIAGNFGSTVEGERVGGEGGFVVDQLHVAPDLRNTGIPVVVQGVSEEVECVADLDVHVPVGQHKVFFIVQEGAVAHEDGAVVAESHVPFEALELRADGAAVHQRVGMFEEDLGGSLRE